MDRVRCATCGAEHDLSEMEPCFEHPQAFGELPRWFRRLRASRTDSLCIIRGIVRNHHYLRVLLPVPVRGEADPLCWGVWVAVAAADYAVRLARRSDPRQAEQPPFPGRLANTFPGMPSTLGLPGMVQLTAPGFIPRFTLDASLTHPLAVEQREGVYPERVLEWLAPLVHHA